MEPNSATPSCSARTGNSAEVPDELRVAARAFLDTKIEVDGLRDVTIYDYFTGKADVKLPKTLKMSAIFYDHMGNDYGTYHYLKGNRGSDPQGNQFCAVIGSEKTFENMGFLAALEKLAGDKEHRYFQENYADKFRGEPIPYLQKAQTKRDMHGVIDGLRMGWLAELESIMQCAIIANRSNRIDPRPDEISAMKDTGLPIIRCMQRAYAEHLQSYFAKGVRMDKE